MAKWTDLFVLGKIKDLHSLGLDDGLAPNRRQAIIWTNADDISIVIAW